MFTNALRGASKRTKSFECADSHAPRYKNRRYLPTFLRALVDAKPEMQRTTSRMLSTDGLEW